jgi:hypothetical protein
MDMDSPEASLVEAIEKTLRSAEVVGSTAVVE